MTGQEKKNGLKLKQPYETKMSEEMLTKLGFVYGKDKSNKINVVSFNKPKQDLKNKKNR